MARLPATTGDETDGQLVGGVLVGTLRICRRHLERLQCEQTETL